MILRELGQWRAEEVYPVYSGVADGGNRLSLGKYGSSAQREALRSTSVLASYIYRKKKNIARNTRTIPRSSSQQSSIARASRPTYIPTAERGLIPARCPLLDSATVSEYISRAPLRGAGLIGPVQVFQVVGSPRSLQARLGTSCVIGLIIHGPEPSCAKELTSLLDALLDHARPPVAATVVENFPADDTQQLQVAHHAPQKRPIAYSIAHPGTMRLLRKGLRRRGSFHV